MKTFFTLLISFFTVISVTALEDKNTTDSESNDEVAILIKGNVSDKETGESLVGVKVQLKGTDFKAYTDLEGNFTFENVKPGEYTIESNYISYKKKIIENQKIDLLTNQFNVKLEPL